MTKKQTGKKRPVNADSAYRSKEKEEGLIAINIESRISEKGSRNHPLTAEQKASNTEKSIIISRDEIIFGAPAHMVQHFVRTIEMMNLVYNIMLLGIRLGIHLGQLIKRDGISTVRRLPKTQKSQPKFIKNLKYQQNILHIKRT